MARLSISETQKKKGGRPRVDATPVMVRLPPSQLSSLDKWITDQREESLGRPEAIRRLLDVALRAKEATPTLDERIANAERKIAREIPPGPSPASGLATMKKGLAEVERKRLLAKQAAKQKPARDTKPPLSAGKKGSAVQDGAMTRRALVDAASKIRGKKKP